MHARVTWRAWETEAGHILSWCQPKAWRVRDTQSQRPEIAQSKHPITNAQHALGIWQWMAGGLWICRQLELAHLDLGRFIVGIAAETGSQTALTNLIQPCNVAEASWAHFVLTVPPALGTPGPNPSGTPCSLASFPKLAS